MAIAEVAVTEASKNTKKVVPTAVLPAEPKGQVRPAVSPERWPDKKLLRLGEVADLLGVEAHVVRFWLQQFKHVRPERSDTGRLLFARPAAERLLRVRQLLYDQGFTIAGARKMLSEATVVLEPASAPSAERESVAPQERSQLEAARQIERLEAELRALTAKLQAAQAAEAAAVAQLQAHRARQAAQWREFADDLGDLAAEVRG